MHNIISFKCWIAQHSFVSITNAREKLKTYHKCPPNGLVLFCGNDLVDEDGRTDKKLMIGIDCKLFYKIYIILVLYIEILNQKTYFLKVKMVFKYY